VSEQKTFAVLCTGPSINDWNEFTENVVIGCNEIPEYDFTIDYYCALDHNSIERWGNDTNAPILTQPSREETVNGEAEYLPNNRDIHNELGFEADCAYRTITTLSALAWAVLKDADVINIYGMDLQYKPEHDNQYKWRRDWKEGVFHDERQWFKNFKLKAENNGISVNRRFKDYRQDDVWTY
jgi:hypothetical protein